MTERAHDLGAVDDAATLLAIESIKQLKARYCRFLDTKDWAAWRTLFSDDFVSDTAEAGGKLIVGADDFVAFTRKNIGRRSQATAHQVHAPEIELTSPTTARGVWALQDVVRFGPGVNLVGYGHYHETYRTRRAVAYQELQADPTAGGHRHSPVLVLRLRPDPQRHRPARPPDHGEVTRL